MMLQVLENSKIGKGPWKSYQLDTYSENLWENTFRETIAGNLVILGLKKDPTNPHSSDFGTYVDSMILNHMVYIKST